MNEISQKFNSGAESGVIIREIAPADIGPVVPKVEGTAMVLQCNVPDYRGEDTGLVEVGALTPEARTQEQEIARKFFEETLAMVPEEERLGTVIMVIGASTRLLTETGLQSDRKRGVESAEIVLAEAELALQKYGLSEDQLMNKPNKKDGHRKPFEISRLQDLKFLKDSPEFADFLRDKYGTGRMFWIAFEEMLEEEKRQELNAEGPEQIAERVDGYLAVLANGLRSWHEKHPGKRVLVWVVSHRDNMGPFFKVEVSKTGQVASAEDYLNIQKGGGFVIDIDPNGKTATTTIRGTKFDFELGQLSNKE
ncbi:MAG: hypothetical protein WCV69_02120 [Patescibacteria group bacterium]|jgi:hypothetical protein